ncbi:MAG: hypothetical protein V4722_17235 [Bacteroidota bacterium]
MLIVNATRLADVMPPGPVIGAFLLIVIAAIAGLVLLIRYFVKRKTK